MRTPTPIPLANPSCRECGGALAASPVRPPTTPRRAFSPKLHHFPSSPLRASGPLCLRAFLPLALLLATPGCSSSPYRSHASFTTGERLVCTGDWDDLAASVKVGAAACEMAIVDRHEKDSNTTVFELRTITDEGATLTATRKATDSTPTTTAIRTRSGAEGPVAIEMEATIGLFGDRDAERKLLRAVQARLMDLEGVDFRTVR